MEKMLDKKSRDFAKNMRDTMIYDKSKNEVKIGTNLYVDGKITSAVANSGTKLYKHYLHDASTDYWFILITTNSQPFDFSVIDTYKKLNDYLSTQNVIKFTDDFGNNIQYESVTDNCFYYIYSQGAAPSIQLLDDWSLANTTDTVTEL